MAKKKPKKVRKHPYIPGDATHLFGHEIFWMAPGVAMDYSMEPRDGDSISTYIPEYWGKIIVQECEPDSYATDAVIVSEDGASCSTPIPRMAVEGYLREKKRFEKLKDDCIALKEEIEAIDNLHGETKQELKKSKERVADQEAEIIRLADEVQHFQAKALEASVKTKTPISLREAIGGEPSKVEISW